MHYNSQQAAMGIFGGIFFIIYLVVLVFMIVTMWKVYTKAGQPGWAVLIPVYNFYILLKIIGRPTWWLFLLLLLFIPGVNFLVGLVLGILIALDMAKVFGKTTIFAVIGLWLFAIVGYPMLAWGNAKYTAPKTS